MISNENSSLVIVDIQARLMPAIDQSELVVSNAKKLVQAAHLLQLDIIFTEQNPDGLGATLAELTRCCSDSAESATVLRKTFFDAAAEGQLQQLMPPSTDVVIAGCETHVCLMQTTFGLLNAGRRVFVVSDACGSRSLTDKDVAVARLRQQGAEIVTTEMVLFEWLRTSEHPQFKKILGLIK